MGSALVAIGIAIVLLGLLVYWTGGLRMAHVRDLLAQGATFIDVDSPEQYASSHPEGAQNVPFDRLPIVAPELGPHDHPIVVYGHNAWRSAFAAWRLRAIGFHEVVNMRMARD